MCVTTLLTSDDLYWLEPGLKFNLETNDHTYEATKIAGFNSACEVDIPELGEEGEAVYVYYDDIMEDGSITIDEPPLQARLRRHPNGSQ